VLVRLSISSTFQRQLLPAAFLPRRCTRSEELTVAAVGSFAFDFMPIFRFSPALRTWLEFSRKARLRNSLWDTPNFAAAARQVCASSSERRIERKESGRLVSVLSTFMRYNLRYGCAVRNCFSERRYELNSLRRCKSPCPLGKLSFQNLGQRCLKKSNLGQRCLKK
jgi:hypothetical protein